MTRRHSCHATPVSSPRGISPRPTPSCCHSTTKDEKPPAACCFAQGLEVPERWATLNAIGGTPDVATPWDTGVSRRAARLVGGKKMRWGACWCLAVLVCGMWGGGASGVEAACRMAHPAVLRAKAEKEGSVRMIVGLRTPFVPEGRLARAGAWLQRGGFAATRPGAFRLSSVQRRSSETFEPCLSGPPGNSPGLGGPRPRSGRGLRAGGPRGPTPVARKRSSDPRPPGLGSGVERRGTNRGDPRLRRGQDPSLPRGEGGFRGVLFHHRRGGGMSVRVPRRGVRIHRRGGRHAPPGRSIRRPILSRHPRGGIAVAGGRIFPASPGMHPSSPCRSFPSTPPTPRRSRR